MVNKVLGAVTDVSKAFDTSLLSTCLHCNSLDLLCFGLSTTLNHYIPSFFFVFELLFKFLDLLFEFFLSLFMLLILGPELVNFTYVLFNL